MTDRARYAHKLTVHNGSDRCARSSRTATAKAGACAATVTVNDSVSMLPIKLELLITPFGDYSLTLVNDDGYEIVAEGSMIPKGEA